jgi:hexosaminidase
MSFPMRKNFFRTVLFTATYLLLAGCVQTGKELFSQARDIGVTWELVSNFKEAEDSFEARFTLRNHSSLTLEENNWALFFNMAPRPITPPASPQPASVQHINGDWYKLVPNPGFRLAPGASVDIRYWGTEGVIKETDAPLGLYFVFYNEQGEEMEPVQVTEYTITPFTRPEQMLRGKEDQEPLPTARRWYRENLSLSLIPAQELLPVIPTPVKMTTGGGTLSLDNYLPIYHQKGLENEALFLSQKLKNLTGTDFRTESAEAGGKGIFLRLGQVRVNGVQQEAYRLAVDAKGVAITGSDPAGVFYGVQSLLALVPPQAFQTPSASLRLAFTRIEDAPRFPFRGLHMDVSRNFQTKETILRTLDLLAFYKINRFLFYTTEDEGWRLEIEGLPELTEVGAQRQHTWGKEAPVLHPAYGSGPVAYEQGKNGSGYYTKADFVEILKYAKERHIQVIPELNFPGHARAAIKAMEARYNRLMQAGKAAEAEEYRLIDPDDKSVYLSAQAYTDNVVSVARESTYRFYEKVVDEISKMYQEAGLTLDVMHAGGDEVPEGAWAQSPMAARLLQEQPDIRDPKNLQAYFFRKLLERLEARNLTVHAWEEAALMKAPDGAYLPNPEFANRKVVPYIWNNMFDYPDLGYRLANMGYQVVLCNVSNFYFDLAYNNDPQEQGLYWAGFVDTRNAWTFSPFNWFTTTTKTSMGRPIDQEKEYAGMAQLKPEARKNILGVEAQLWSETIKGRDMLEYYMLPKLMGFAESAWAAERSWENMQAPEAREKAMNQQWNVFSNTLGQKELPRLSWMNEGYNYRVPLPGAVIEEGMLKANAAFPGLSIRYTTDGSEPHATSPVYEGPVQVSGEVKLKSFDAAGKSSRTATVSPGDSTKELAGR